MSKRRTFLKNSLLSGFAILANAFNLKAGDNKSPSSSAKQNKPITISTWYHGLIANEKAWSILSEGGAALDAVEKGVRIIESDPTGTTVGLGGLPDRDGKVTLDACIMDHRNQCGAVSFLQDIEHPISVARKVMEETPHVMLTGEGAKKFALENGFPERELLTESSKKAWEEWRKKSNYQPVINIENHDTIGALALDKKGNLSGACTTSGLAYKMHGRVGDSPIIGAGLFVDNEVGAACATGMGEAIIRIAGSAIVVELMRQGKSPQEACEAACQRVIDKHDDVSNIQVAFIALNKNGAYGSASIHPGFAAAIHDADGPRLEEVK